MQCACGISNESLYESMQLLLQKEPHEKQEDFQQKSPFALHLISPYTLGETIEILKRYPL